MDEEFPPNSERSKRAPEESKIDKVIVGPVVRRRAPLGRRFIQTFFGGEPSGVMQHVIADVLLPAARDMVADAISQGVERIIFGEVRNVRTKNSTRPGYSGTNYTSYNRYSSNGPLAKREDPRPEVRRPRRQTEEFEDIILGSRPECTEVIDRLFDLVNKYGHASVSDLNNLVGVSSNYTDEKWGWTDMQGATSQRDRDGYRLILPRPEPLT